MVCVLTVRIDCREGIPEMIQQMLDSPIFNYAEELQQAMIDKVILPADAIVVDISITQSLETEL